MPSLLQPALLYMRIHAHLLARRESEVQMRRVQLRCQSATPRRTRTFPPHATSATSASAAATAAATAAAARTGSRRRSAAATVGVTRRMLLRGKQGEQRAQRCAVDKA